MQRTLTKKNFNKLLLLKREGQVVKKVFDIKEELRKLPAKPGVYLMHDKSDAIIYVGRR